MLDGVRNRRGRGFISQGDQKLIVYSMANNANIARWRSYSIDGLEYRYIYYIAQGDRKIII
jgi:hypothetical protein